MKQTSVEIPEKDVYRFTFTADAQELEDAVQAAYLRSRSQIQIEGYEKGAADRKAIEAAKGESVFWYEAINDCMAQYVPDLLDAAIAELGLCPITDANYELLYASTEKGFAATATLVNEPDLAVGQYTGFTAKCMPNPVSEQDVEHFMQRRCAAMAKKVEFTGPVQKGMTAVINYEGFLCGKPFAGGKADNQPIDLGAGRMIPGFEEGIEGHSAGEDFEIHVTFPENYGAAELAGQPAVFKAHLVQAYARQVPPLDDAFAKMAGGVETLAQYRVQVRQQLEEMRRKNAMNRAKTEIVRQLGINSKGALPHALTEDVFQNQMQQLQQQLAMTHKTVQGYLAETGQKMDDLIAQLRAAAEEQVRVHIILLKIARLEGLEPTEEQVDEEIAKNAKKMGCTPEQYEEEVNRRTIFRGICAARAADFVVEHSIIE